MSGELPSRLFTDFDGGESLPGGEANDAVAWERLLEDGTRADLRPWLGRRQSDQLTVWLTTKGDRLSARSWSFWRWLLGAEADLPRRGTNPFWPDAEGAPTGGAKP